MGMVVCGVGVERRLWLVDPSKSQRSTEGRDFPPPHPGVVESLEVRLKEREDARKRVNPTIDRPESRSLLTSWSEKCRQNSFLPSFLSLSTRGYMFVTISYFLIPGHPTPSQPHRLPSRPLLSTLGSTRDTISILPLHNRLVPTLTLLA